MGAGPVPVGRRPTVVSLLVASVVTLTACSAGSSDTSTTDAAEATPSTTQPAGAVSSATTPPQVATTDRPDSTQPATVAPPSGPPPADVAAARSVIDAATRDTAGAASLDAIRFTDAGQAAAEQALADGVSGAQLWAATWLYTSTAIDPAPLVNVLTAPDPDTRALAAAGALSFGESAAAPVLVELLADTDQLAGSEPPLTIGQFAASTLARYIDAPAIPADLAPPDLVAPWTEWLAGPGGAMRFDPESGRWTT